MIFGDDLKKRDKWFKLFNENPLFIETREFKELYDIRETAYRRIKAISDAKMFSIYDFINDPINLFTCHEMLSQCDGSLATKFTV